MTQSWRDKGACRGIDPDVFYPLTDEEAEEAKAVCAVCSVRQACLRNVFAARAACEHYGLSLMVEPIPFERRDGSGDQAQSFVPARPIPR